MNVTPEELRVGNYLHDREGRLCKVEDINCGRQHSVNGFKAPAIAGPITALPHKPIEITADRLLKLGFVYDEMLDLYQLSGFGFKKGNYTSVGVNFGIMFIDIKYIHQLQNLYFVLIGKELILKT